MLELLRRYREYIVVAVLLVLPLGVFFAHARTPEERTAFDRAVMVATRPLEKAIEWAVTGTLRAWDGYVALRRAREEARLLRGRVERLELERQRWEQVEAENLRLEQLLHFANDGAERTFLGARVVGVRLDPKGLQLVTVDRGASAGVRRMMPVVTAQGVVGRIHAVTAGTADVLLLVDRNSAVAARVDRSRARATVRGLGGPDLCRLDYALRADDLIEGDLLVTSGTDGVFPRGLPLGKVTHLRRQSFGLYQNAEVIPAVDVTKLEEILVITSSEASPQRAPAAQAAQGSP
ncbi:MAG TPA: rod shape-determining protein MreC [Anaeromyxobacteraceae bacterium]|nr:rod shape-determining protein MreC [Anaeromyxobacteraceae bacterium]